MRIGVPFLFFMLWLIPSYLAYALLRASPQGMLSSQQLGLIIHTDYAGGLLWRYLNNTRDVWFLYDLLWFYALTLLWLFVQATLFQSQRLLQKLDAWVQKLCFTRWIYLVLPVASTLLLMSRREWYPSLDTSLNPSFALLIFYGMWYLLGWWLWLHKESIDILAEKVRLKILLSVLLYLFYLKAYFYQIRYKQLY